AKDDRPSRFASFATAHHAVSASVKRVVPFLKHPVNIALPFDCFVRQFRFVRWQVSVTVLRNELFSESYRLHLCQVALLRIGGSSSQQQEQDCRAYFSWMKKKHNYVLDQPAGSKHTNSASYTPP